MAKAVILAGGRGIRISEETGFSPKPMIKIGSQPILWHILKIYSTFGINDFVICCGYKGHLIKEYFSNYALAHSDITFDLKNNTAHVHRNCAEDWKVTLVDTGEKTMTGGRLARVMDHVRDEEYFHFTYGDCVADIDVTGLEKFHREHGKLATITSIIPPSFVYAIELDSTSVKRAFEKPLSDLGTINGGFFVLSPKIVPDYLAADDKCVWEDKPVIKLAEAGELKAFEHNGFFVNMNSLQDKNQLQELWDAGSPPWKIWK